jgi:hypothetical protein
LGLESENRFIRDRRKNALTIIPLQRIDRQDEIGKGTGNREQGTGKGTGNREGNREQGIGNREQGTGNREQGIGNRE